MDRIDGIDGMMGKTFWYPGRMPAFSRWLRTIGTIPPDTHPITDPILEGSQNSDITRGHYDTTNDSESALICIICGLNAFC